ncbi:MAG: hypothetical protein ACE5JL_08880 [Dehalococcoidia bacterium]
MAQATLAVVQWRRPRFYGWRIVALGFVNNCMAAVLMLFTKKPVLPRTERDPRRYRPVSP